MPVIEVQVSRLQNLVGRKTSITKIKETLPYLGLDIESEENDNIRLEYSPNRPDYSTDTGIALGLQGLLGIRRGLLTLNIKNTNEYQIFVDSSVAQIRPFVTGIVAKDGNMDETTLRQLISMQEDLHSGIGRKRKKSSLGIHDLDTIKFPLKYTTTDRNHRFIPLTSNVECTISEVLETTEVGREYRQILGNSTKVPIIIDAEGHTVSFPPIINAALTTVTTKTKNLFIEVTGMSKTDVEDVLSIIATILQSSGFKLETVKISGSKNSTPQFRTRKVILDESVVNHTLGLSLSKTTIVNCLKKCRLDAVTKRNKIVCTIPRYRFDIFGPTDIVEEVAIGYGIENLKPALSTTQTLGQISEHSTALNHLSNIMVGLGYVEALNLSLTSKKVLYEMTNRNSSNMISVTDSKSQEHTILKDSMLPALIDSLSKNIHEPYPQKLFETGTVFTKGNPVKEEIRLGCVSAHQDANFTEIKSVLQSALKIGFNIKCETKTSTYSMFANGRTASVLVNGRTIGVVGEVDSTVIQNFKIRVPIVGFEIKLSGLIFN